MYFSVSLKKSEMRIYISSFIAEYILIIFFIQLLSYFSLLILTNGCNPKLRIGIRVGYIFLGLTFLAFQYFVFSGSFNQSASSFSFLLFSVSLTILYLIPLTSFAFFSLFSIIFRFLRLSRISDHIVHASILISTGVFLIICWGIVFEKYQVQVIRHELFFSDLPESLDGIRIVQVSDAHLGSFGKNFRIIETTKELINSEKPDILVFSGDIVNNFAEELDGFVPMMRQMQAQFGKVAILGNHDYGDYSIWQDSAARQLNFEKIKTGLMNAGFELLLNSSTTIPINDTVVYISGVENWGHSPFPQYADLAKSISGIPANGFHILLSHDPAHWMAQVVPETNIPLTLAGHTHGGQFGIKIAGIEFSPIYFIQKNWGGLYHADNQYLYVNRGLGVIGFPGRIEMRPEITVLTLRRARNR